MLCLVVKADACSTGNSWALVRVPAALLSLLLPADDLVKTMENDPSVLGLYIHVGKTLKLNVTSMIVFHLIFNVSQGLRFTFA